MVNSTLVSFEADLPEMIRRNEGRLVRALDLQFGGSESYGVKSSQKSSFILSIQVFILTVMSRFRLRLCIQHLTMINTSSKIKDAKQGSRL